MSSMGKVAEPYVEEVADGVFAYIQPDGTWFLNNTGIVVGDGGILLVDQCGTVDRGRALLDTVRRLSGSTVYALVNTHHHGDHTFGNFLLPESVPIIGHHRTRTEMVATGTAITALFQGPEWGAIEVRPPSVTFTRELTVWLGDLEVRLIHFERPAHTTNDTIIWIPDREVVFSGDLVFNGGTPFALQGSIPGWRQTLPDVGALGASVLIPGHGPTTTPAALDEVERYLGFVWDAAVAGRGDGLTALEAARRTDLGAFAELTDPERLVGNLHRAYDELDGNPPGAPIDLVAAARDMAAYLGGPIVSHA